MNDSNEKLRALNAILNGLQKNGFHVNWGGADSSPYLRVDLGNKLELIVGSDGDYDVGLYCYGDFDGGEAPLSGFQMAQVDELVAVAYTLRATSNHAQGDA
jgi:hypothetical protein